MPSIRILTPGYWPLPKFVSLHAGKKWMKLKAKKLEEKEAEYEIRETARSSSGLFILEAEITKALPKKIHIFLGRHRLVLSRWIGGLYSNLRSSSSQRAVRSFYDAISSRYSCHVEPGRASQLAVFLAYMPRASKVLDASAGDCAFAKEAARQRPDLDVWCSDISGGMLELGGEPAPGPRGRPVAVPIARRFVSSASRLPFPPSSFDVVLHSFSNLHPSDRKFFCSFARVLKTGGLLIYHPVKAPGEQWPKEMEAKTKQALLASGFSCAERKSASCTGPKHSTLVFYRAAK